MMMHQPATSKQYGWTSKQASSRPSVRMYSSSPVNPNLAYLHYELQKQRKANQPEDPNKIVPFNVMEDEFNRNFLETKLPEYTDKLLQFTGPYIPGADLSYQFMNSIAGGEKYMEMENRK